MAQKPEDQPQIVAKTAQPSLLQLAARDVHISEETFPTDLVINVEGNAPKSYDVLSGKAAFSEKNWQQEYGHFVQTMLSAKADSVASLPYCLSQSKNLQAIAKMFLERIINGPKEIIHQAALGLCILAVNNLHEVGNAIKSFDEEFLAKKILEKHPMDNFLQAAMNSLLNQYEKLLPLEVEGIPFEFPPFQKAIPYYPDYGNHVTLIFKDGALNGSIMRSIVNLIQKLKAQCHKIDQQHPKKDGLAVAYSGFNVGFELNFWLKWCKLLHRKPLGPVEVAAKQLSCDQDNFMKCHPKLRYTYGHMWLYLKADAKSDCDSLLQIVKESNLPAKMKITAALKKNGGRIFDGQFVDGISSAVDAISMVREVLVPPVFTKTGQVSPEGGTFAFVQFFQFDNPAFQESSQPVLENMIGRSSGSSETLAHLDKRCHIKRARIIRPTDGTNTELIRQPLPYVPRGSHGSEGPSTKGLLFVAFGKSVERFFEILENMFGPAKTQFTHDLLLSHVQGKFGKLFYCPSTKEIEDLPKFTDGDLYPPIPFWNKYVSKNSSYFYNHIHYLYTMSMRHALKDTPSKRILHLMSSVFARWHSTWIHKFDVPRLPHLSEFLKPEERGILEAPIQERKGFSYKKMLGEVFTSNTRLPDENGKIYGNSANFDTYRIDPKELIVGVTDRLSFGSGKEVMPYLIEGSETSLSRSLSLTEAGNMGHIVPGHNYLLELGIAGMLERLKTKVQLKENTLDQQKFYQSAIYAFEGVQLYLLKYAQLARMTAKKMQNRTTEASDRQNLREIADRLIRLAVGDPRTFTFHDAVQLIFSMHCCLHLVGQPVSVGRLDQLLAPYYQRDLKHNKVSPEEAQEIIDAFFIKFDEHVVLNPFNIPYGHTTYGSTCVTGRGGPFPTGDSMNQWIQQITVGGYGEDGVDACNEITLMCLRACRRLPLNAPCVSLRLTPSTPDEVKKEAAHALLSGGAHPILFHDDRMVEGLYEVLRQSYVRSNEPEPKDLMQIARSYSCDGCFEPMFSGRSEFKFAYIFLLKAVIYTLNSGADYQHAGPLSLAGEVYSRRTPLPEDIKHFDHFKTYFLEHLKLMVEGLYSTILNSYGDSWLICPSPLLSCLMDGCMDCGNDMSNGGSRFHIISPMYVGFANTVNSLYNVKKMVYDDNSTVSLETLRMALFNNWGESMVEPFYNAHMGSTIHTKMWAQRFFDLRDQAVSLPKYGTQNADEEMNDLAVWLATEMNKITYDCLYEPGPVSEKYEELKKKYSVPDKPFLFQIMTGCGTFENYVSVGAGCGATPDGRLSGQPIASDCSQQPHPQDKPVPDSEPLDIIDSLKPYTSIYKHIPNGCEVDLTIPEDFSPDSLVEFIDAFIKGETGSNLVTVTCVDRETQERAQREPQKFDLVRNRMGGWSNFFVSMFPEHQLQHARRPVFGPHKSGQV